VNPNNGCHPSKRHRAISTFEPARRMHDRTWGRRFAVTLTGEMQEDGKTPVTVPVPPDARAFMTRMRGACVSICDPRTRTILAGIDARK
jgi:hypothetical protein